LGSPLFTVLHNGLQDQLSQKKDQLSPLQDQLSPGQGGLSPIQDQLSQTDFLARRLSNNQGGEADSRIISKRF